VGFISVLTVVVTLTIWVENLFIIMYHICG